MRRDNLPAALQSLLDGATLTEVHQGMSGTQVLRIERDEVATHFLKSAIRGSEQDLQPELALLLWLQGKLWVPEVVYYAEHGETQLLLMTAVPGVGLHEEALFTDLPTVVKRYGEGLRQIHALPIQSCLFDARNDVKIAIAHRRLLANEVDESDFDDERQGRTAQSAFDELLATRPVSEDLVFAHGDYCTPNVLIDPVTMALTGFIDWGRAGVADRYLDLGIAMRSVIYNYGEAWVAPFFEAYGLPEIDTAKVAFYRLLDEFF